MLKGGYQILNFENEKFSEDTPIKISGIYQKLINNHKVVLVSGLVFMGNEIPDFFTSYSNSSGVIVLKNIDHTITVTTNDYVTVSKTVVSGGSKAFTFGKETEVAPFEAPGIYSYLMSCIENKTAPVIYTPNGYLNAEGIYSASVTKHFDGRLALEMVGAGIGYISSDDKADYT